MLTVDQLPSVTLVRFVMDLSELDGGCQAVAVMKDPGDMARTRVRERRKWSSQVLAYRRWIVREWHGNYVRNIDLRNAFGDSSSRPSRFEPLLSAHPPWAFPQTSQNLPRRIPRYVLAPPGRRVAKVFLSTLSSAPWTASSALHISLKSFFCIAL